MCFCRLKDISIPKVHCTSDPVPWSRCGIILCVHVCVDKSNYVKFVLLYLKLFVIFCNLTKLVFDIDVHVDWYCVIVRFMYMYKVVKRV